MPSATQKVAPGLPPLEPAIRLPERVGPWMGEDGRLEVDGVEAGAVARARALRAEGRSLREIAVVLDAEGHRPRGMRWHVQTLARVVAS